MIGFFLHEGEYRSLYNEFQDYDHDTIEKIFVPIHDEVPLVQDNQLAPREKPNK